MKYGYQRRTARDCDARDIARLIEISSSGVAAIEWRQQAERQGCTSLDIGERLYRNTDGQYSYRNCVIAEKDNDVAGMLLSYATADAPARDPAKRPGRDDPNVFAPYMYLEEANSWYICGIALFPGHRGQGIGSELMRLAHEQARANGFKTCSLLVFEQNTASVRLYQRLGYRTVDQAPVVPHPMIHYRGNVLLMTTGLG